MGAVKAQQLLLTLFACLFFCVYCTRNHKQELYGELYMARKSHVTIGWFKKCSSVAMPGFQ